MPKEERVPSKPMPEIGVVSVKLAPSLIQQLITKAETEATGSASSDAAPAVISGAQNFISQVATTAVVQSTLNKARMSVGAAPIPVISPQNMTVLRERMATAPPLPHIPWRLSSATEEQPRHVGACIRPPASLLPSDAGRLKMDVLELATHLATALVQPSYPTTVLKADNSLFTYGPPIVKDQQVMRYCELDYDEPRERPIVYEKMMKWRHGVRNGISYWLDSGSEPWTVYERRKIVASDGTYTDTLCQIQIRSHWLLSAKFE